MFEKPVRTPLVYTLTRALVLLMRCTTVKRWSVGTARQLAGVCATVATRMACPQTVGAAAIAAAAELRSSVSPRTRAAMLDAELTKNPAASTPQNHTERTLRKIVIVS